jgi:hypothetical protein
MEDIKRDTAFWNLMDNKNMQRYITDKMKIKIKYHTVWTVLKYKYIVEKLKFATISSLQNVEILSPFNNFVRVMFLCLAF